MQGGPAVSVNVSGSQRGSIVPFGLSKEHLQQFYTLLDRLTEILQEGAEEPQAPARPVLRLVKSNDVPIASSAPR